MGQNYQKHFFFIDTIYDSEKLSAKFRMSTMLVSTRARRLKKFSFAPSATCTESLFNVTRTFTNGYTKVGGEIPYEYHYNYTTAAS